MQRCQSGSSVITRRPSAGGVMQHDGSRVGDAAESCGHHALGMLDFGVFQPVVDLPIEAWGKPCRTGSPGGATKVRLPLAASCAAMVAGKFVRLRIQPLRRRIRGAAQSSAATRACGDRVCRGEYRRAAAASHPQASADIVPDRRCARMRSRICLSGWQMTTLIVPPLPAPPTTRGRSGWAGRADRGSDVHLRAEAGQRVNPSILAGEEAQADAAEALRRMEEPGACKKEIRRRAFRDTWDQRRGAPVCAPDRRPARAIRCSTSGMLILTGQTS